MRRLCRIYIYHKRGQATTELAIMGAILIMVLGYLIQQGYIYNCRQALEMYAFRKALELSQQEERGITLTVIRDIISPSFFTGLNRQRLMATASVEYNPYKLYIPYAEDPEDTPSRQLVQIDEAMIRNNYFFEVPPTKVRIDSGGDDVDWMWTSSMLSEIDPQTLPVRVTRRTSSYDYQTSVSEDSAAKTISKDLQSTDTVPTAVTFEDSATIVQNYFDEDWKGEISSVEIDASTIPRDINFTLQETVRRQRSVQTAH